MDISGQSALVTGGGSGLGAATARRLAAAGCKVAVFDVNAENAESIAEEIGGIALACDVTSTGVVEDAIRTAKDKHGPARILVNCAGVATAGRVVGRDGPHDLEIFKKVIDVNLVGSFNLLRLVAADMIALDALNETGERGVIINTASVAAFDGQIGQAAYAASKGALVSMTLPIARELAKFGVRCVTIAPGLMETPMMAGFTEDVRAALIATTVFPKRLGAPDEFAALALHICENALLNGETIRLDGAVRLAAK